MDDRKLAQLGRVAFSRSIEPLKSDRRFRGTVLGFDTEYVSKNPDGEPNELLCFQLGNGEKRSLTVVKKRERLTPLKVYHQACRLLGNNPPEIMLITFFSLAELQHLPVVSKGFNVRTYARGSLDVSFKARYATIHIFDLARWFDGKSLANAAKALGLEKGKFDTRKVTRACLRDPVFKKYAKHDAFLVWEIMRLLRQRFLRDTGIDPLVSKTPASASAGAFRKLHVTRKLYCDNNRARYLALKGTWGGRAEVFARGRLKGQWTEYDFTSAYPTSALKLGVFPVQKSWQKVNTVGRLPQYVGGFAQVRFKFNRKERYPCLPVFTGHESIYPLEGETFCTFEEIKVALKFGAECTLIEAFGYRDGTPILADYLRWTMKERAKAKGAARVMFKLLGNAVVGKLAQRLSKVPVSEFMRLAEKYNCLVDELFELRAEELEALGAKTHVSVGPIFMPEWNGLITGYTRAALAEVVRSSEAVYCHTDSVWTKKKPKTRKLPFDAKTHGKVTIVRTRFAGMGEKFTAKLVKTGKAHVAHHSVWNLIAGCQMLSKFDGQDFIRKYPIRRPLKLREAMKSGRTPGVWVQEWRCANTVWDNKRCLLDDGSTLPWRNVAEFLEVQKAAKRARRKVKKK